MKINNNQWMQCLYSCKRTSLRKVDKIIVCQLHAHIFIGFRCLLNFVHACNCVNVYECTYV